MIRYSRHSRLLAGSQIMLITFVPDLEPLTSPSLTLACYVCIGPCARVSLQNTPMVPRLHVCSYVAVCWLLSQLGLIDQISGLWRQQTISESFIHVCSCRPREPEAITHTGLDHSGAYRAAFGFRAHHPWDCLLVRLQTSFLGISIRAFEIKCSVIGNGQVPQFLVSSYGFLKEVVKVI